MIHNVFDRFFLVPLKFRIVLNYVSEFIIHDTLSLGTTDPEVAV